MGCQCKYARCLNCLWTAAYVLIKHVRWLDYVFERVRTAVSSASRRVYRAREHLYISLKCTCKSSAWLQQAYLPTTYVSIVDHLCNTLSTEWSILSLPESLKTSRHSWPFSHVCGSQNHWKYSTCFLYMSLVQFGIFSPVWLRVWLLNMRKLPFIGSKGIFIIR